MNECLTKPKRTEPAPDAQAENPMATIPSEQAAAMTGMAYFTDGISDKVKAFFRAGGYFRRDVEREHPLSSRDDGDD